ncbi:MAG TPA: hypothetical protein PLH39_11965, partial [Promineifilum sp.]|nr:hypothetical protein [Promineifilum sp.]
QRSLISLAQSNLNQTTDVATPDTGATDTGASDTGAPDTGANTPPASGTPAPTPAAAPVTVEELVAAANAHLQAAEQAQRDGDWARYGQELAALRQNLAALAALTGQ